MHNSPIKQNKFTMRYSTIYLFDRAVSLILIKMHFLGADLFDLVFVEECMYVRTVWSIY